MYSVWPLTYEASSDARKKTTEVASSRCSIRRSEAPTLDPVPTAELRQEAVVIDTSAAGELLNWCGRHSYSKNGTWRWSVTNYERKGPRTSERRTRSEEVPALVEEIPQKQSGLPQFLRRVVVLVQVPEAPVAEPSRLLIGEGLVDGGEDDAYP